PGNYTLAAVAAAHADITAAPITGSFTADTKVYDAPTAATVSSRDLSGVVEGDAVSLTGGTARFGNKNVATGKTVALTGASLSGTDAGNYTLDSVADANAAITALSLTGSPAAN